MDHNKNRPVKSLFKRNRFAISHLDFYPAAMLKLTRFSCVALAFAMAFALPLPAALPKVELQNAFPALKIERPIWMAEAPDGSGRLFILEQQGRILLVRKDSDGANASEFLNIVDRKPF